MGAKVVIACAIVPLAVSACGTEDPRVTVPWLRAEPAAAGRVLKIGYESDPCTRAREARVTAGDQVVAVTLFDPEREPEQACIELAKPGCVTVRLAEPLGHRRVRDAAPSRFPRVKRGAEQLPFTRFGRCRPVPVDG